MPASTVKGVPIDNVPTITENAAGLGAVTFAPKYAFGVPGDGEIMKGKATFRYFTRVEDSGYDGPEEFAGYGGALLKQAVDTVRSCSKRRRLCNCLKTSCRTDRLEVKFGRRRQ